MKQFLWIVTFVILSVSCENQDSPVFPVIKTNEPVITFTKTIFAGSISNVNGRLLSEYGFVWDVTTPVLETSNKKILGTISTDQNFVAEINTAFQMNVEYFVRSYYVIDGKVFYGETVSFTVLSNTPPSITSIGPQTGTWKDTLVIEGLNFSVRPFENIIHFGDVNAVCIEATESQLKAIVPESLSLPSVPVSVKVLGYTAFSASDFHLTPPEITSFSPAHGHGYTEVTLLGKHFKEGLTAVYFDSIPATISTTTDSKIVVNVPAGLPYGNTFIRVCVASQCHTASMPFKSETLTLGEFSPASASYDDIVTIHGAGFSPIIENNRAKFGETVALVTEVSDQFIKVAVPRGLQKSSTKLTIFNGYEYATSTASFHLQAPEITDFNPKTGTFRTSIILTGQHFNPIADLNRVRIGDATATVLEATPTSIRIEVPDAYAAATGMSRISLAVADVTVESGVDFELTLHALASFSPVAGKRGDQLTITGQNFNPSASYNEVFIGPTKGVVSAATATTLSITLPVGVMGGSHILRVRVAGRDVLSNETYFIDDPWSIKSNVGGGARKNAFAFAIGDQAFVGGGIVAGDVYKNTLYRFNQESNTWTKMADIPINGQGLVAFATTTKGYVLLNRELWQYDPERNQWKSMADFPGQAVRWQSAFAIGDNGYVGTGSTPNGYSVTNEFYEYREAENQWHARASYPQEMWWGVGFSVGSKGYITTGSWAQRNIWEYDPSVNQWQNKGTLLGVVAGMNNMRLWGVGISGKDKGYISTGTDDSAIWGKTYNDLYEYDPATNTLTRLSDFPGPGRMHAFGFSLNQKVYIGGGTSRNENDMVLIFDDFYEYSPKP